MRATPARPSGARTGRHRIAVDELREVTVKNVTDQAAERTEAVCSEAQRLLESLGILPPKPLPKRQWWWWIAAGALTAVAGVAVAAVRQPGRLFPMED